MIIGGYGMLIVIWDLIYVPLFQNRDMGNYLR